LDIHARPQVAGLLRQGSWFGGFPPALQMLILQRSVIRSYQKGQFIIGDGAAPRGLFAVLEGQVHVVCHVGDADEVLVHIGEAGFWFGDHGVHSGAPSIGSVIAESAARTLLLPVAEFERIITDDPRSYRAFASLLVDRYAFLFRYMAQGQRLGREGWLCTRLADLAELRRRDMPASGSVTLTVSQADLATMVGVSRQTLNALLARLRARGLIEVGFRRIAVLDEAGLRQGCEPEGALVEERSAGNAWPVTCKAADT